MLRRVIAIQRALPITLCRMNRTLRMKRKQRTQANEGTLLDPDGSSSSSSGVPFPWSRFYLLLLLTEPAAHIIWRAAVPDLGLLTAARPPPDRSCLSPRVVFVFFDDSTDEHSDMKKKKMRETCTHIKNWTASWKHKRSTCIHWDMSCQCCYSVTYKTPFVIYFQPGGMCSSGDQLHTV